MTNWITRFAELVAENRGYLTELDSAIGDADHGANMARGMAAVSAMLETHRPDSADELFKSVGRTLVSGVGGASGPLYGTFFLRVGAEAGPVEQLDTRLLAAALRAGVDGIIARGRAEIGDKTMLDAMAPALDAFDAAVGGGSSAAEAAVLARAAAELGRDATRELVARKGRASYLGERSVGHLDPGATSAALALRALAETLSGVTG